MTALSEARERLQADGFVGCGQLLRGRLAEAEAQRDAVIDEARMQGDALAGIFSALLDPDRRAADLSEREQAAADIAASALEALQSRCPHEAQRDKLRGYVERIAKGKQFAASTRAVARSILEDTGA